MQLHFIKDAPDSVSTDFQNLNKFNEQVNPAAVWETLKSSTVQFNLFICLFKRFIFSFGFDPNIFMNSFVALGNT